MIRFPFRNVSFLIEVLAISLALYDIFPSHCCEFKVDLCKECIQWATDQNRTFLRQTLEARLVRLYNDLRRYQQAQQLGLLS